MFNFTPVTLSTYKLSTWVGTLYKAVVVYNFSRHIANLVETCICSFIHKECLSCGKSKMYETASIKGTLLLLTFVTIQGRQSHHFYTCLKEETNVHLINSNPNTCLTKRSCLDFWEVWLLGLIDIKVNRSHLYKYKISGHV